ncbi:MAG: BatA domain-containing protein [Lentisphaeria bacterium]|nr:BatA domain-containing protein [Lentisphaeria bacterium]NQZ66467.1 BatA domain-containing protein [Lentisphaeria bacterium]
MSFLYGAMLAGFAGLAIPTVIHLIAKHKFPIKEFPSIMFLLRDERTNTFARKLIDIPQLLLRLLILALIVLAMSRLFDGNGADLAPRNVIVIIDTSASMKMVVTEKEDVKGEKKTIPLNKAKEIAKALLSKIKLPSSCALVTTGDDIKIVSQLGPNPDKAIAALEKIEAGDGTGPGIVRAVALCGEMIRGRREVKSQIFILTDQRESAFSTRNQQDVQKIKKLQEELGDQLDIIIVDLASGTSENLAITSAVLQEDSARIGDHAHITTKIKNYGNSAKMLKLNLSVANKIQPKPRDIKLEPGEEVVVDLTAKVERQIKSYATVSIKGKDAAKYDNESSVPFVVAPSRRILLVNGSKEAVDKTGALNNLPGMDTKEEVIEEPIDGTMILRFVLNPGRELGRAFGTGIDTTTVTPEALPAQTLSKYHCIILYDVDKLNPQSLDDLHNFVSEGRSVLMICSGGVNPMAFNSTIGAPLKDKKSIAPATLGVDLVLDPPAAIQVPVSDTMHSEGVTYNPGLWISHFRDRRKGDLSVIRFRKIRKLLAIQEGSNVLLKSDKGEILAIERKLDRGRTVMLTFGTELSRGNIAMSKAFPVFMWRLIDYLTDRLRVKPPNSLLASQPAALDVSDQAFAFSEKLELYQENDKKDKIILNVTEDKTVYVPGLSAGHYWIGKITKPGALTMGYRRPITVNPDPRESIMTQVTNEELKKPDFFGPSLKIETEDSAKLLAPTGNEKWHLLILLLIAVFIVEAIAAYIVGYFRQKRLEEEQENQNMRREEETVEA